ncbi:hypothetical protein [Vibrio chagasii]|uniref:hypothetical protein n=1 Tax=Vibrio chagasii TaxID=170679 RepID=UPI0020A3ECB8|nr:hypothetical protein [Vibrio chagasii]
MDKLGDLSTLNIRRDSDVFVGRCIDEVTGNMLTNATAIKLTAIKMLCHVGCPVGPELQSLERQYFPDTAFPSALEHGDSEEESLDEVEHRSVHLYADMVRAKWPDLTEAQIDNVCDQVEVVVAGYGETLDSAKGNVQCMINKMRKSSTVLATIRANYKKVIAE